MDWTKHETERFITIEEALNCLNEGTLNAREVREIINATIDDIIAQSKMDIEAIKACRNFLKAIGYGNKEI